MLICTNVKIALNAFLIHGPNVLKVCQYFYLFIENHFPMLQRINSF